MEIQRRGSQEVKNINYISNETRRWKERKRTIEDMKESVARLNTIFQKVK